MPFRSVSMIAAIALFSSPAIAQTSPDGTSVAEAKPVKPPKPHKICRTVAIAANSRVHASICKTAEEWERDSAGGDGHIAGNLGR
jgi:hypothetical protein